MATKEGEHVRATSLLRTGYMPTGPIQYPTLGSLVAKEIGSDEAPLPNFVSVAPTRFFGVSGFGPGYLGPQFAPLVVGETNPFAGPNRGAEQSLKVQDVDLPADVDRTHAAARLDLLQDMESEFVAAHPGVAPLSHQTAYNRAVRLMRTEAAKAFNLEEEAPRVRDAYGRNLFGQGCLLARRLVERGVPFVEVNLGGWDTHQNNFQSVQRLCGILDPAWGQLMTDLDARGLLETTTIICMGEFGRTPRINQGTGRDHFPNAWSAVLAGGGLRGGQAHGKTSEDGTRVEGTPTGVTDLLATLCAALGIDHLKQNPSNVGRPIRIVDKAAKVIQDIVA
jgi:uncharacterized protein (DUF1501 family)